MRRVLVSLGTTALTVQLRWGASQFYDKACGGVVEAGVDYNDDFVTLFFTGELGRFQAPLDRDPDHLIPGHRNKDPGQFHRG